MQEIGFPTPAASANERVVLRFTDLKTHLFVVNIPPHRHRHFILRAFGPKFLLSLQVFQLPFNLFLLLVIRFNFSSEVLHVLRLDTMIIDHFCIKIF